MEAFYSTIFVAVLALFGLLVAALIYVAQSVQDRYSTKLAQRLLKGRLSLSFWFFGLFTILLASLGLFAQAYPSARILAFGRFLISTVDTFYYGAASLLGVFLVLLFFILTLRSYARLLSPLTVLEEMARSLTPYAVRDIALLHLHNDVQVSQIQSAELYKLLEQFQDAPDTIPGAEIAATAPAKNKYFGRLSARLLRPMLSYWREPSKIAKIKKTLRAKERAGRLEDPLGDLFEYGLSAIGKNNVLAWRAFLRRLARVFSKSVQLGLLAEDAEVPFLGDTVLLAGLERLSEEIEIAQRFSLLLLLNGAVEEICEAFMSVGSWVRVVPFLTFLQEVGAKALFRKDGEVFRSSVGVLTRIGVVSIKKESESHLFDDVCRKIGWLGEKLILGGIEESPIMPSGNETEELGEITEAIYKLSTSVREGKGDKYPLILRDAIEVICDQALKKNEPKKFEETILSLFGIHEELAQDLVVKESKNAGAYLWLVLHCFKGVLSGSDLTDYRELRNDIFSWVGYLAREAVAHNQPAIQFWGARIEGPRDLCGLVISFMVQMGTPHDWDAAMREVLVKSYEHVDEAWKFIKRAAAALHSNFGLMFDPETGEDYSPEDPRRR